MRVDDCPVTTDGVHLLTKRSTIIRSFKNQNQIAYITVPFDIG